MIGPRVRNGRRVSGEGGSCFYRAVAYQLCEFQNRPYLDRREVSTLRARTSSWLGAHSQEPVPSGGGLAWRDIGAYTPGYAQAPVPQAMAYVIGRPVTVHVGRARMRYGKELPGTGVKVRLVGQHYSICY